MQEPNYISYSNSEAGDYPELTRYGIDDIPVSSTTFQKTLSNFQPDLYSPIFLFGRETETEERDLKQENFPEDSYDKTSRTDSQTDNPNPNSAELMVAEQQNESELVSKALTDQPVSTCDIESSQDDISTDESPEGLGLQEIAAQSCNYEKHLERTEKSVVIRVKPSNFIFESLENHLRENKVKLSKKARARRSLKRSRNKRLQKTITFNQKNFSKKLGDQFCEFVWEEYKFNCSPKLKDKMSWKLLNKYLIGESVMKGLSAAVFLKAFINFMQRYDLQSINESKTNENSKIYYKICAEGMKIAFLELETLREENEPYGQVVVRKGYPEAIIEYYFNKETSSVE